MKRSYPDVGDFYRNKYLSQLISIRKLIRLWGTTTVNGVEVLNLRQYYYPANLRDDENFEKLFKFLGAYEDVTTAKMKGIKRAWFYFNKNKATALSPSFNPFDYDPFVCENLNKMWWDPLDGPQPENLSLTTSIVIEPKVTTAYSSNSYGDQTLPQYSELIPNNLTDEELIELLPTIYNQLWETCKISQQGVGVINHGTSTTDPNTLVEVPDEDDLSPDDPWLQTFSRYVMLYNNIPYTIKKIERGLGNHSNPRYRTEVGDGLYSTYVVTIEIPYYEFLITDLIVNDISDDIVEASSLETNNFIRRWYNTTFSLSNTWLTRQAITQMYSYDLEDEPTLITRDYTLWEDVGINTNPNFLDMWVKSGKQYYLKADPFLHPSEYGLRYSQLNDFLFPIIDTGYKKKSASFFKKLVAAVVFIALVVVGVMSGGLNVITIAKALVSAYLVMTIATIALSLAGFDEWAMAFSDTMKFVEPLVLIAQIILVVDIFSKASDKLAKKAGEAAAEKALEEGATEAAAQKIGEEVAENFSASLIDVGLEVGKDLLSDAIQSVTDIFSGNIGGGDLFSPKALGQYEKMVKLIQMPQQNKLKELRKELKDLQAEYDDLAKEMADENNTLLKYMFAYPKQLAADWSIYAEQYDFPYETGQGSLALGNIQRTTVQAMREGDYSDPAFADILGYRPISIG